MALPPEHIKIKRRRDEEPVETLYIEQKRQRSNYLWSRIRSESSSKATISALQQPHALPTIDSVTQQQSAIACVPIVRITLRSEDKTDERKLTHAPVSYAQVNTFNDLQVTTGGSESASDPRVLLSTDKKSSSSKLIPRPRKFHLTSSATSSMSASVVPEDEVQKSKKRRRDLAVFVEKRKRISPFDHDSCRATNPELRNNPTGNTQDGDGFRKFESKHCPLNGGIDKEESNKRPKDPTSMITKFPEVAQDRSKPLSQSNFGLIALTEQLHQATPQDSLIHIKTLEIPLHKPQPKIKPKPPRPRLRETQLISTNSDVDEAMVDGHFVEDDEDFIYDTYVRSSNQMAAISIDPSEPFYNLSDHMPDQIDINKIGILIIAEEDQAVWETFGEEEESDKDWNSEEEDENAEDFYGNDYPEDEVNSDDEFGMGAYDHRHRASDDEEFDEDTIGWSDEEEGERRPWKHNVWGCCVLDGCDNDGEKPIEQ